MRIKALNKVPVLINGEVVHMQPGEQYDVPEAVGEDLLRGNDAVTVAEEKKSASPAVAEDHEVEKPGKRQGKNAGRAPQDKNAGAAPEDK